MFLLTLGILMPLHQEVDQFLRRSQPQARRGGPALGAHKDPKSPPPDCLEGVLVGQVIAEIGGYDLLRHLRKNHTDRNSLVSPRDPDLDSSVELPDHEPGAAGRTGPALLRDRAELLNGGWIQTSPVKGQPGWLPLTMIGKPLRFHGPEGCCQGLVGGSIEICQAVGAVRHQPFPAV